MYDHGGSCYTVKTKKPKLTIFFIHVEYIAPMGLSIASTRFA